MPIQLGTVSHFSIGVNDMGASAAWWTANFDLDELSRSNDKIVLGNDAVVIALFKGKAVPGVLGHLAFRTSGVDTLEAALAELRASGIDLEDPGEEIGPVAPGSSGIGLWFHDPDGYRWELYVPASDANSGVSH
jgi:catechol 2,3-dioxygenase-like lactoylglutathione lyase family enzyme